MTLTPSQALPPTPPPTPLPPTDTSRRPPSPSSWRPLIDSLFEILCQGACWLVIALAILLVAILVWRAWLAIVTIGPSFFTGTTWDPVENHKVFGALAFIWGTLATSAIAMALAVPFGVGTAAYLSEIAPAWVRSTGAFLVEMLAAIPSVVYGFWGLFVFAPFLQKGITALGGPNTGGSGILAAGIILSIMIVPYVTAVTYDACRSVPRSQREGALALGGTRWQTIWSVVIPYARPGIIAACFLALGRALGETMAVTMLIGNKPVISVYPFTLGDSIASVIANQFTEATYDLYLSALVELGLVLLGVSILVNSVARILLMRLNQKKRSAWRLPFGLFRKPVSPRSEIANPALIMPPRASSSAAMSVNRLMTGVLALCTFTNIVPLFLILGYLIFKGVGALNWEFFVNLPTPVGETGGGMAHGIVGSAMLVGLATALAVPLGLLAAIYLAEYRSDRLGPTVRFIGELMGGVPSIVIGIFAYYLVVRPMGHFSGWAGSFALGMMMIPIVMRTSEEALKLVPVSLRNASYALGASQWQTVWRVTVPAALPAIITGVFLALARIGGETAPLLLTASGNMFWARSPNDFTPSLPVLLYDYSKSGDPDWNRQAWAAALVLLSGVMILNVGVRWATGKRVVQASRAD